MIFKKVLRTYMTPNAKIFQTRSLDDSKMKEYLKRKK